MEPVFEFPLELSRSGNGGLVRQLHRQLRAAIVDGRLLPDHELPSTRRVAAAHGIARNTVIAAYDLLVAEGFALPRAGAKAVVARTGASPGVTRRTVRPDEDARLSPLSRLAVHSAGARRGLMHAWEPGFKVGLPDHRRFPFDTWRRILRRSATLRQAELHGYGAPDGWPLLRTAISQHVNFARAVVCTADDVIVTSGAQQAFDLLARTLVIPGRTPVAMEDPGYHPLRLAMAAAGAKVVPVPVDAEGLVVDQLSRHASVVCVTPSHQFPTGVVMSMRRRNALLDFARRHAAVVVEDDYDGEFRYGARPLEALQTMDRDANVVYVGTFSKSIFPALRIGYLIAPAWMREALCAVKRCTEPCGDLHAQDALAHFILDGHLARHIRTMRKEYALRREALLDGLDHEMSSWLAPVPSEAGIHLTAECRDPQAAHLLRRQLPVHAPGAQPISDFSVAAPQRNGVVFGLGCLEAGEMRAAIRRLARAMRPD